MANDGSMISELPEATSMDENDLLYVVSSDVSKKITKSNFKSLMTSDLAQNIGDFQYKQTKAARIMTIPVSAVSGDVIYFKALTWSGASFTQITVQGASGSSYTTVARLTSIGEEVYIPITASFSSFVVSVNVSSVPSTLVTFEVILCNITSLKSVSQYALMTKNNLASLDAARFKYRGYLGQTANINTVVSDGWHLIASSRISTMSGLPDDLNTDAVLYVYSGSLTVQIIRTLNFPLNFYQRYLYNNNQSQSAWRKITLNGRDKTLYLFGDSITKGVLGDGGTGTSYLEMYAKSKGYKVVNCGVGGIGYVYSARKTTEEVPWNTGEGRIRAQDVINHFASELVYADTVVLAYGVNDWQTLGDPQTTIIESDRRATSTNIKANVKTAIETINTAHNKARIIVITPINTSYRGGSVSSKWALETPLNNNNDGLEVMTLEKTYQAIVDACNECGVEYVDMTHNNAAVNYLNISSVLPDKLHPSQATYNRLADTVQF